MTVRDHLFFLPCHDCTNHIPRGRGVTWVRSQMSALRLLEGAKLGWRLHVCTVIPYIASATDDAV